LPLSLISSFNQNQVSGPLRVELFSLSITAYRVINLYDLPRLACVQNFRIYSTRWIFTTSNNNEHFTTRGKALFPSRPSSLLVLGKKSVSQQLVPITARTNIFLCIRPHDNRLPYSSLFCERLAFRSVVPIKLFPIFRYEEPAINDLLVGGCQSYSYLILLFSN